MLLALGGLSEATTALWERGRGVVGLKEAASGSPLLRRPARALGRVGDLAALGDEGHGGDPWQVAGERRGETGGVFLKAPQAGPLPGRAAGRSAQRAMGPVGEIVAMPTPAEPSDSRGPISAAAHAARIPWGSVVSRASSPKGDKGADLGRLAAAVTEGRSMAPSALPLVVPMVQQVASGAAGKPDSRSREASRSSAPGAMSDPTSGPQRVRDEESRRLRMVVDEVVARLMERVKRERERHGGQMS